MPKAALGPYLVATVFAPGRYATAIQRTLQGTHAAQVLVEDSTAAFVLELAADGSATACRGWRYNFTNDGPELRTDERFCEQQGYRGHYTVKAGLAEVELHSDETVCPAIRESALALARSTTVKLRCALAVPRGHGSLKEPALLCQWVDIATSEPEAHLVAGLAPDGWMVLGTGNGLRVWVAGKPAGAHTGEPTEVFIEPTTAPLGVDAWERPF